MTLDQSAFALLTAGLLLVLIFAVLFILWRRARRGGPSAAGILGATYEFYNADQRAAIETVVERAAGKQQEAQPSGEPPSQ